MRAPTAVARLVRGTAWPRPPRYSYAALGAVHIVSELVASPLTRRVKLITKPLLMPALLLTRRPTSPAVRAALVASMIGDIALLSSGPVAVLTGIAGFATAHVAYLTRLLDAGRAAGRRANLLTVGSVVAAGGIAAAVLSRTLDGEDRVLLGPAAAYGVLVSAMGAAAVRAGVARGGAPGRRLVVGGVLFVISDALVAARLFGPEDRLPAGPLDAVIMTTYCTAQACLVDGLEAPAAR